MICRVVIARLPSCFHTFACVIDSCRQESGGPRQSHLYGGALSFAVPILSGLRMDAPPFSYITKDNAKCTILFDEYLEYFGRSNY